MNIVSFLEQIRAKEFFSDKKLICFKGSQYPLLFFSHIWSGIKQTYPIESIDSAHAEVASIIARLEMSFLGSSSIYWLRDLSEFNDKDGKKLINHLRVYQGPNVVVFFLLSDQEFKHPSATIIDIPVAVDKKLFVRFLEQESIGSERLKVAFSTAVFTKTDHLSLDNAYALVRYAKFLGNSHEEFTRDWLESIILPEKSLFTLSQYFFAKDGTKFFGQWQRMYDEYAPAFWITFWSEQIWRAHSFIRLMQGKQFGLAKGIAYRLPFSFIQRDWKKISLQELEQAHAFLYKADHQLKNGGGVLSLDVFYSKFLLSLFNAR